MREIKFRAWDKVRGEMERFNLGHKDGLLYTDGNWWVSTGYDEEDNPTFDDDNVPRRYELMQFSGLHDKDGKDIYEGDIVFLNRTFRHHPDGDLQDNFLTVQIEFSNGAFWFRGGGYTDCNWHHYPEKDRLVIGNVYEHPELLEAK